MTDRPYMEALEQQFAAVRACERAEKYEKDPRYAALAKKSGRNLRRALTYAWSPECYQAVQHVAKTVPLDTTINLADFSHSDPQIPEPRWYWFGDTGYVLGLKGLQLCALLMQPVVSVRDGSIRLNVISFARRSDSAVVPVAQWWWKFGAPLSETLTKMADPEEPDRATAPAPMNDDVLAHGLEFTRFIAAADAWLRQRILAVTPGPVERHRRRQLAREFALETQISDVKVIQLRRVEYERHPTDEHRSVDWSCRWIVDGHWRHQACGTGLTERRLVYVWSYPKGPADKPLRVPKATVYAVDR